MCHTFGLAQARSRAAKLLWQWNKRRESSMLSRWRASGGGVATGERPWFHMFDVMYTDKRDVNDWWKDCDFSLSAFVKFARDYLAHCSLGTAFEIFVLPRGAEEGGREPKEAVGAMFDKSWSLASEKECEKMAKRLATLTDRVTVWDLCSDGLGLEMIGDSLLVCNWASGVWSVGRGLRGEGDRYLKRVARLQDQLERLYCKGLRPSNLGADFVKHEYREGNARADELTHKARNGEYIYEFDLASVYPPHLHHTMQVIGLRGKFDGGVDETGVGIGWWLQIGLLPLGHSHTLDFSVEHVHVSKRARSSYSSSSFPHTHTPSSFSIDWRDVSQCARSLSPSATITDAELSALEGLTEAAERALDEIELLRAFSRASLLGPG